MAVYDCFPFFNELDILELRLAELWPHVDRFVLAESTRSFAWKPKPLHFAENRQRFSRFLSKIEHVVIDDLPEEGDAWDREAFQRNAIVRGLGDARPDDVVLLSDVDEIPFPEVLAEVLAGGLAGRAAFIECVYYSYRLDLEVVGKYVGLCAVRGLERRWLPPMQEMRQLRQRQSKRLPDWLNSPLIRAAHWQRLGAPLKPVVRLRSGWHFTSVNSVARIHDKLSNYAHQEHNTPEFNSLDNIERLIREGRSICGRPLRTVGLERMPATVRADPARWRHLLHRAPGSEVEAEAATTSAGPKSALS
jgi:hypothetical protein